MTDEVVNLGYRILNSIDAVEVYAKFRKEVNPKKYCSMDIDRFGNRWSHILDTTVVFCRTPENTIGITGRESAVEKTRSLLVESTGVRLECLNK